MNTPDQLKYKQEELGVNLDGAIATIGITDYAQDQLSDVVFAYIKVSPGDIISPIELIAVVESVKASSDIIAPFSGKVLEINEELSSSPELLNSEPYGLAWLLKVEITHLEELDHLLDANAYKAYRGE